MTHTLGRPTIRVSGASHLRVILTGDNTLVTSQWPPSIRMVFGEGCLAMAEGNMHSFRKKLIMKAFTHDALENYIPSMIDITRIYLRKWLSAKDIQGHDECRELAFALASKLLVGSDFNQKYVSFLANTFQYMINNMFSLPFLIPGLGLWKVGIHLLKYHVIYM
jgi:cytochrome P450